MEDTIPQFSPDLQSLLQDPQVEGLLRIVLAGALGSLIGLERALERKPAGIRTYGLVAMGSAVFTVGGELIFPATPNIAAQIVTGIGFLGAGTILHMRGQIVGLTTAAGLWVAASLGMVIGGGLYILGIGAAVAMFLVLQVLHPEAIDRFADDDDDARKAQPTWAATAHSQGGPPDPKDDE